MKFFCEECKKYQQIVTNQYTVTTDIKTDLVLIRCTICGLILTKVMKDKCEKLFV